MHHARTAAHLVFWGLWLALFSLALNLKHPLLYSVRAAETPGLILLGLLLLFINRLHYTRAQSSAGARSGNRPSTSAHATADQGRALKRGYQIRRLGLIGLLLLTLGQEGWFQWQRQQVLNAGPIMQDLGRHFIIGFRSFEELEALAERGLIGGIYIKRNNIQGKSREQVRMALDRLQEIRQQAGLPPLFIAADQEGGSVAHLSPLIDAQPALSSLLESPEQAALEEKAYLYGIQQGLALAELGVNLNLSPVVDLKPEHALKNDERTRIRTRAIAADPEIVIRIAGAYSEGLMATGVHPTLKHFPGLGKVRDDTHLVPTRLNLDAEQLAPDWAPFRRVSARTGAAIMLAHVDLPRIDPDYPVSQSQIIVQKLLRQSWQYNGLLITDDLNMGASYQRGIGRATTAALNAGIDLVLISYDPDQYYRALYQASRSWRQGGISSQRWLESSRRLQAYWQPYRQPHGITDGPSRQPPASSVTRAVHGAVSAKAGV